MDKIALEIRSDITIGRRAMQMATQRAIARKVYIFLRKPAPTSCSIILRGLRESVNLPTGSGRYGFTFGSSLASPTLLSSASAIG